MAALCSHCCPTRATARCRSGVTLKVVPTTRRRHAITETPAVQAALDELRAQLGSDGVDMADLVIRGAREKVAEARAADEGLVRAREKLAQWVLAGDIPGDPTAALEARESWKGKLPAGALT